MRFSDLAGLVTDGLDSIRGIVDDVNTTDAERLKLRRKIEQVRAKTQKAILSLKEKKLETKRSIISSAKEQPFWRSWRGLVMLGIFLLAALHSLVPSVAYFDSETLAQILKWGLGGYVGGEVLEKVGVERERRKSKEAEAERERQKRVRQEVMPAPDVSAPSAPKPAPPADIDS